MFLVRYVLYAGGALLALLLIADWHWPAASINIADDQAQEASLNREILRIRSAQKWPQKIDFDTNIPTIVPPPALVANVPSPPPPAVAAETGNKSLLNARAEAKPAVKTPPRKVARHRATKPARQQSGPYPVASAWSPWW